MMIEDGLAALDAYERSGDPADLRTADRLLREAGHPDRTAWAIRLSDAFTFLAGEDAAVADHDAALAWTEPLLADPAADQDDRDLVVARLADLEWDRSWLVRYADDRPPDPAAELDRLLARLSGLAAGTTGPEVTAHLRLLYGMALAERAGPAGGDVGGAIEVLEAAIAEAARSSEPVGNRLALGAHLLAEMLLATGHVDRAVTVLHRAIDGYAGTEAVRSLLSVQLATALQRRWHERLTAGDHAGAAADLSAGLAVCQRAGDTTDPWLLGLHGELLTARAERDGSDDDARTAADLLERAARAAGDDPDGWLLWRAAATAYRLRSDDHDALIAAITSIEQSLALDMPPADRFGLHADWLAAGQALLGHGRSEPLRAAVDAGTAALDRAPDADDVIRAELALLLVYGSFAAAAADLGAVDPDGIHRLLAVAADHPDGGEQWQALVDYGTGTIQHYEDMLDPADPGDGGLRHLARAAAFGNPDADFAERLRLVLVLAGHATSGATGDRRTGAAAGRQNGPRPGRPGPVTVSASDLRVVEVYSRLMEQLQAEDVAGASATARDWLATIEDAELDDLETSFRTMVRAVAAMTDPAGSVPLEAPVIEAGTGIGASARAAGAMMTYAAMLARSLAGNDVSLVRRTTGELERFAATLAPADRRLRIGAAGLAGHAHLEINRRTPGDTGHARRAAQWLRQAMELAGGPGFPLWAPLAMNRAEALRRAGDPDLRATRHLGLSALQGYAWQVFAQAGTDHSIASARRAAADARTVAGWCLADRRRDPDALEQLVAALDAGRGLVLRATTTARSVADRLTRAGHPGLAAEWTATAGQGHDLVSGLALPAGGGPTGTEVPDDLRLRVLRAVSDDEVLGYELITTREIRTALRSTGTQALVYLLAAEDGRDGAAIVVPAGGPPVVIMLPRLETGPESPVRWYVRRQPSGARARGASTGSDRGPEDRDLGPVAQVTEPGLGLAELCAWAWDAAMSTVLRVVRGPRLVLIPMGMLALVPWHAAVDDRGRHAAEKTAISYSPSARAFCTSAARPRTPVTSALIVGDPTGDLPYAEAEARAIRDRFYPGAATARTPAEVLSWAGSRAGGGAVLHFACHGAVDPRRPADAHLVLAGHAGLTVRALLEGSATAELDLREVFLAACTTGVSGDDHDEVLSLAASFLAAGAHTVFGSLWPVPDGTTSLLMFKLHEALRVHGLAPADALHQVQRWMRDPDRDVAGIPPEVLGDHRPGTVFPLTAWAGFVHIGR